MYCTDCKYVTIALYGLYCPKLGIYVAKNESACSAFKEVKNGNLQRLRKKGVFKTEQD